VASLRSTDPLQECDSPPVGRYHIWVVRGYMQHARLRVVACLRCKARGVFTAVELDEWQRACDLAWEERMRSM
jgi:hypothetical protein